jgi:drug/metabolite transporter (DMT)-like permease
LKAADTSSQDARRGIAVAALLVGAAAIGASALFVKVSETGPVATAFWRVALALPFLWTWSVIGSRGGHVAGFVAERRLIIAAGLFFAGDLALWHWSIMLTSVANATLLANLAPIFVAIAVWLLYGMRPTPLFLAGLAAALVGVAVLLGGDFRAGGGAVLGDILGVATAMFYGAYQLTVTRARSRASTSVIMAWSGLITAVVLLPLALVSGEQLFPHSAAGWAKLVGLALISQVAGQSLIAYAMAHLPATFSSVGLLAQPVIAAALAWVLLGETLGWIEIAGAIVVLAGIRVVHQAELGRRTT